MVQGLQTEGELNGQEIEHEIESGTIKGLGFTGACIFNNLRATRDYGKIPGYDWAFPNQVPEVLQAWTGLLQDLMFSSGNSGVGMVPFEAHKKMVVSQNGGTPI